MVPVVGGVRNNNGGVSMVCDEVVAVPSGPKVCLLWEEAAQEADNVATVATVTGLINREAGLVEGVFG